MDPPPRTPADDQQTKVQVLPSTYPMRFQPGDVLDDTFRLTRVLGSGGMGTVFEAEDARLGRRVALKVIHPGLADEPEVRTRFLREVRATAGLEHDNVVRCYSSGDEAGVPYYVMEMLDGESLRERVKRAGPPPLADAVRIGLDVAHALAAAHDKGMVHRDITPGNVFLTADGRTKLLDFGLVRVLALAPGLTGPMPSLSHPDFALGGLTRTGVSLGTPGYIAPEQAAGRKVDHRTDLFSLGCVLYLMATGRPPFPTAAAGAVPDPLPAPVPPRHLNPAVPEELDRIILRLMAVDPDARPSSAAAVADRLAAVLAALPPAGGRFPRRRIVTAAAVAAAAGAVAAYLLLFAP